MPVGNNTSENSSFTVRPPAPPPDPIIDNPGVVMSVILVSVLVTAAGLLLEITELTLAGVTLTLAGLAFLYGQYLQAKGAAEKCAGTGPWDLPAGKINLCPALFAPSSFVDFIVKTPNGDVPVTSPVITSEQPMVWLRYTTDRAGVEGVAAASDYEVAIETLA